MNDVTTLDTTSTVVAIPHLSADTIQKHHDRILRVAHENNHPLTIAQQIRPLYGHWGHAYFALLASILDSGYVIKPVVEATGAKANRPTLYLRHDVHWVGIPGALAMMDIERKLGIRSTYYIMWDYRCSDRRTRDDYLLLRKFGGDDFEYGLHECVFDEAIFSLHLNGEEDPVKTRDVVQRIIEDAGLTTASPETLYQRDEYGFWMLRSPESLPTPELRTWVTTALEILEHRILDFREAWGQCSTINGHGGYAFMRLRELGGLPPRGSFQIVRPFQSESKAEWSMLWQSFRAFPLSLLSRLGVRSSLERLIHNAAIESEDECLDVWDGQFKSSECLLDELDDACQDGNAAFLLLHPDIWSKQHYLDLGRLVLDRTRRQARETSPGPLRHALYRTALMEHAGAAFTRELGVDRIKHQASVINYSYRVGNFEDRARRLVALLAEYDALDRLQDATVYDLGGGCGSISSYLASYFPIERCWIFDVDEAMLALQAAVYRDLGWDHLTPERADLVGWTAPDEPADLVFSYGAFEFVHRNRDIATIFRDVGWATRPGGIFVANVWNHRYPRQGYSQAWRVQHLPTQTLRIAAARMMGRTPKVHFRSLSHRRWCRELTRAGFSRIRLLSCEQRRGEFFFSQVIQSSRSTHTHIWVMAEKE